MKKFSSKEGYYKYYTKEGKSCRIKVHDTALTKKDAEFVIFWLDNDGWSGHIPSKKFKDVFDVIKHILKNLETDKKIFRIM